MPSIVPMKALLEAGVHFGHQTRRWDPRMKPYIFTQRDGIHIIDLQQTVIKLGEAYNYVRELAANGGTILFVGTKKQAQEAIELEATRCGMPYVNHRWLGGTLTNFSTIQQRIRHLEELEAQREQGAFERLPKKEAARLEEEINKLNRMLGGIRNMRELPSALFIIDPAKERIAVAEARRLEIPIVAPVDTNCNPDEIEYPIPANDDAIRAVKLLTSCIADAVLDGKGIREAVAEAEEAEKEAAVAATKEILALAEAPEEAAAETPAEAISLAQSEEAGREGEATELREEEAQV